jgi:hypothetical protein
MSSIQTMSTTGGNRAIVWVLLAIAILVNIAGFVFGLYSQFVWFDEVVHCYTSFAVTLPLALYAYGAVLTGARNHTFALILVITAIGLALGGLWEVAEWLYDTLFTQQNTIKSVPDRLIDLIVDAIGAFVAGIVTIKMVSK